MDTFFSTLEVFLAHMPNVFTKRSVKKALVSLYGRQMTGCVKLESLFSAENFLSDKKCRKKPHILLG